MAILLVLALSPRAAEYTWDCNTTSGIQPCGGSFSESKFTTDGTTLVAWPGAGNGVTFAGASGIWDIAVNGTQNLDHIVVSNGGYHLAGPGILNFGGSAPYIKADSNFVVDAILAGTTLSKQGAGTLVLTGANTLVGPTTIATGTLRIGADDSVATLDGDIVDNGALVVRKAKATTLAGRISGTGSVRTSGAGQLTLAGANTYAGPTTVDSGSSLRVANNAALGGTAGGTYLAASDFTGTHVYLANGVTVTGETLNLDTKSAGDKRSYLRVDAGDTATWNGPIRLTGDGVAGIRAFGAVTVRDTISGNIGIFQVRGGGTGTLASRLALGSSTTFTKTDGGTWTLTGRGNQWGPTKLSWGTLVLGVDDALPSTSVLTLGQADSLDAALDLNGHSQTLDGLVDGGSLGGVKRIVNGGAPTTLTLGGSGTYAYSYLIEDAGHPVHLVKRGSGRQIVYLTYKYTGPITVDSGVLQAAGTFSLGDSSVGTTITAAGTLDIAGNRQGAEPIVLDGGRITNSGARQTIAMERVRVLGDAEIDAPTGWDIRQTELPLGKANLTIAAGGTLTKTGAGEISAVGVALVDSGRIVVDQGPFAIYKGTQTSGPGDIVVHADGDLEVGSWSAPVNVTLPITMKGGALTGTDSAGGPSKVSGTVFLDNPSTFRTDNRFLVDGAISGPGGLTKSGTGMVELSGRNTFSGSTLVRTGILQVQGTDSASPVTVLGGGTLSGKGSVGAVFVVGGTLHPGSMDSVGTQQAASVELTADTNSTLAMRLRGTVKPGTQYDRLKVAGNLILGAGSTLVLDLSGLATTGTANGIVQASGITGTFGRIKVLGGQGFSVRVVYRSTSIDAVVVVATTGSTLDTTLAPSTDTTDLDWRNIGIGVPPRTGTRRVALAVVDSVLGHGIAGADSALLLQGGTTGLPPLSLRIPVALVPQAVRKRYGAPTAFRLDGRGKLWTIACTADADSFAICPATDGEAVWLGFDTVPPTVGAGWTRDSIPLHATISVDWTLRDNTADAVGWSCLLRAGSSLPLCSPLDTADSAAGRQDLSSTAFPLGARVWFEGRDSRSTTRTAGRDVVVEIDTLRAPTARLEDRYELVALPYRAGTGSAHAAFAAQWGADDPRAWRAWRTDSTRFSEILQGDSTDAAGRGFWVRTRGRSLAPFVTGGWSVPLSKTVPVRLVPGWNMVGQPLGFDVSWSDIRARSGLDSLAVEGPFAFDGAAQGWSLPDSQASWRSWSGAAFLNSSGRTVVLQVPSIPSGTVAPRSAATGDLPSRVGIRATQAGRASSTLRLGRTGTRIPLMAPLPPSPATTLVAAFRSPLRPWPLLAEIRASDDTSRTWSLSVSGLVPREPLTLDIADGDHDTTLSAWVLDARSGRWLPAAGRMEFAVGDETSREFAFRAARPAGADATRPYSVAVRDGRRLLWSIPDEAGRLPVRIELRDLAGRLVGVLVDESMDPGSYARDLPARAGGEPLVVRMTAGGTRRSALWIKVR